MQHRSWIAVAAVTVLAAVGAVGCSKTDATVQASDTTAPASSTPASTTTSSSSGGLGAMVPSATPAFLSSVAAQTTALQTGQFSLSMEIEGVTGIEGKVMLMDMSGAFDKGRQRSRLTLDMSGLAAVAPEAVVTDDTDVAMYSQPIEIVSDNGVEYVKVPGLDLAGITGSKAEWFKTESADDTSSFEEFFKLFDVNDIGSFLETLQSSGQVDEVGAEEVDGVKTTHYHADIDPSTLDTGSNKSAGELLDSFGSATEASVDVWVDGNALVHKLSITGPAKDVGTSLGATFADGTATMTMRLSDLGRPVDIEAPPADDVFDTSGLGPNGSDTPATTAVASEPTTTAKGASTCMKGATTQCTEVGSKP